MLRWQAIVVFVVLFLIVTVLGFYAARWRRGDLELLHEWGLAGRRFGTVVTWFLLGGDLYTAYTFIAVPALLFATGALGFFAVPYTIIVYPLVFVVMPRLWSVARRHGYITPADFVRGRYDSQVLALAVAVTGILATMPYIALQLVGIQVVIAAMGVTGTGLAGDLPLIIAFLILAAYTYTSGLRAPALIAVVKDLLIYITMFAAVIVIPAKLGGFGHIFAAAGHALPHKTPPATLILAPNAYLAYATLALGSALALFMYPHAITGVLASTSRTVVRRNAALLPAYSLLLGLLALLGYMAIAAGVQPQTPNGVVPALFVKEFPEWFAGFAFAAIAIGALVPAAIMSIAASNLFTRNIYGAYLRPDATAREEAATAKLVSLLVKIGALAFIVFLPRQQAINFQLLGGVWILQTFPAIVFGLYTRWLHRRALLIGWAAGMVSGTLMAAALSFKSPVYPLQLGGHIYPAYAAFYALIVNVVIAVVLTLAFNAVGVARGNDETTSVDYEVEVAPAPAAPAGLA
jgi:SSS family solute:Na+ symporter